MSFDEMRTSHTETKGECHAPISALERVVIEDGIFAMGFVFLL
jgi:hypothetical protein